MHDAKAELLSDIDFVLAHPENLPRMRKLLVEDRWSSGMMTRAGLGLPEQFDAFIGMWTAPAKMASFCTVHISECSSVRESLLELPKLSSVASGSVWRGWFWRTAGRSNTSPLSRLAVAAGSHGTLSATEKGRLRSRPMSGRRSRGSTMPLGSMTSARGWCKFARVIPKAACDVVNRPDRMALMCLGGFCRSCAPYDIHNPVRWHSI
ncbi:hypothetical protein OBBRIDRAFT_797031 [Obba rivulosa]|uniref:Uncharacterized protein n=1 Tax=Obba rivulosa TaxID=1052685 RepID=A0A8E2AQP6_9APHY|nr:hypothetical protein OBBRIDRAFT_797031 [Obba rivulosa]